MGCHSPGSPSPGNLPDPKIESKSLTSPTLVDGSFTTSTTQITYDYTVEVTNRFKGLDMIVSEELWMEVHNTVQEVVIKTIPKKKECKKAKWLSEEALQKA